MRKYFYKLIAILTAVYSAFMLTLCYDLVVSEVPDNIYVREGETPQLEVEFPFVVNDVLDEDGVIEKKHCSMFGIIPVKEVAVNVVKGQQVYISGEIVGIYTKCEGVFVINTCEVEGADGKTVNPAENQIRTGDYILAIDGNHLSCKEDMALYVKQSQGRELRLTILRNGKEKEVYLKPVKNAYGEFLLGIWIKDDLAGIGTLTFVTPTGEFGCLGHGMANGENNQLFEVEDGILYTSNVIGIQKSQVGHAGELKGVIRYNNVNQKGEVIKNSDKGIYGCFDTEDLYDISNSETLYDIAYKQEIKVGPAQIVSEISGKRQFYDIQITYVDYLTFHTNKGLYIEVTDPKLLELTGGIVQGMSGSPIIQDGKIVGAVTHVLVNEPTKGYGIFIENMINELEK